MLTPEMVDRLNAQINLEFFSANIYLQMSAWLEAQGLEGSAAFMRGHANEEMAHMHKLFDYVNETGAMARLGAIDAPPAEYESVVDLFSQTYEHECAVTKAINALAHAAFTNQDYSTFNFLQWYVAEQHEEEKLIKSILDKFQMVGQDGPGLFLVDRELGSLAGGGAPAEPDAGP